MEQFDLYDDNRILTGRTLERGQKCGKGENRLVVHICVFNSKGEMLIQQRQPFKRPFSNMWDFSCGGGVLAGETSREGAHRELLEELGIDYDFAEERPYLTINFENGFNDFYFLEMDVDINTLKLQTEEVQSVKWASLEEIMNLRNNDEFIPYYKSFITSLFELRLHRGLH